ncbi:MAG: tetraacyldisaccharide 4'-kinase [Alphaproteobacteria bacterium]|nr:tetraacyldisaccharide 4'-kinase [Alphaproteobacteria bacterium]
MKTPWWFLHKTPLAFLLLPVAFVYYFISRLVFNWRRMFAYKSRRKVVCIGGILAGGVGKTPIVRTLANYLDAPVVMRGYKRTASTANIGDEATMLMHDGIAVHVGHRKSNIMLLDRQKNEHGPILMDDGLQNPLIKKDVSILVFDQMIGYGNGFLLPAGPLREPKYKAKKADAIIIIKNGKPRKRFKLPSGVPIFYAENKTISPYTKNTKIVAFAGIGYPKKFFKSLDGIVAHRAFGDHYQYTDEDILELKKLAAKKKAKLVTTEKDWVRLPIAVRDEIKYAKLETVLDTKFFDWLKEKLNADDKKTD